MLSSGKQGLTVPAEPSPAESRLGAATRASQSTKCTLCFHCASSRYLLGPSRSQDLSQGSVESRGQGGEELVPLQSGAGFSLAATARRLVFPLHPLVAPGPQSTPVQDKPLCAMTLKDSYVPALFLGVLSTDTLHSVWTSRWLCHPSHHQLTPAHLPILQTGKLRPRRGK